MSQGHREVVPPTKFITAVTDLAKSHWNINVRPLGTGFEAVSDDMALNHQLYFSGIRRMSLGIN